MSDASSDNVLVNIFLRGGMDGVAAVPPYTDPKLWEWRPRSRLPAPASGQENALLELDGTFALHPSFAPLWPFFKDGRLAIVHGVGSPEKTRSHFDQQEYLETGMPGNKGYRSGWLNRALSQTRDRGRSPFRAVAITAALPLALYGDQPALAIPKLEGFGLQLPARSDGVRTALERAYREAGDAQLRDVGGDAFEALDLLHERASDDGPSSSEYPEGCPLGASLRQIARLIKAQIGLTVAWAEYAPADWDTHTNHAGMFTWQAGRMAKSIAAFHADLGELASRVVVMSCTEFGRTIAENGSNGTDHGRGTCFFLLGDGLAGGKVYGTVPSLAPHELEDGRDLPVTTDFRAVFSEVAARQLGAHDHGRLFPGWRGEPLSLWKKN